MTADEGGLVKLRKGSSAILARKTFGLRFGRADTRLQLDKAEATSENLGVAVTGGVVWQRKPLVVGGRVERGVCAILAAHTQWTPCINYPKVLT